MGDGRRCSRCGADNQEVARFCARCGHPMSENSQTAGRVPHPDPLQAPEGFRRCREAADLYYHAGAAWGGSMLLGTEGFEVRVFNAGYPLESLVLKADGMDDAGNVQFSVELSAECLSRREEVKLEVPSYAIAEPAHDLTLSLISAEYGS